MSLGSQRRPPLGRAEPVLQDRDLPLEELDLHGLAAELGHELMVLGLAMVVLAGVEPGLSDGEELVTPLGESCGRDAELAGERVQGLAAEDAAGRSPSCVGSTIGPCPVVW